ncbi:MAG: DNA repair protein RecN [Vicingaceae bacterium]
MLKQLKVQNFALINQLEIKFEDELSVITGETGAGKSILLGALRLILGERADHGSLMNSHEKCVVEGQFSIKDYELESFFSRHDLDFWEETVLRREVTPQGKSRSFINDTPATLAVMKEIGGYLVDLHSQHQSLQLNEPAFQLEVIDALANTSLQKAAYGKLYFSWKDKLEAFNHLQERVQEAKRDQDYWQFQFDELEALDYKTGEESELNQEQEKLAHSEELIQQAQELASLLEEAEPNAIDLLKQAKGMIEQSERYMAELKPLSERFNSTLIELEDIKQELLEQFESIEHEPKRLEWMEDRLGEIHRLKKKHAIEEADQLVPIREELDRKLAEAGDFDAQLESMISEIKSLESALKEEGKKLSKQRLSVLPHLEVSVKETLQGLGIADAVLKVAHTTLETPTANGLDTFNFLFSANQGVAPQKLANTASGGEISRLVLAVKALLAEKKDLPTILFDEIDTGVSGEVADKMGVVLSKMAQNRQVISITHLPQIAAKGKQHFFVYKQSDAGKTYSQIKQLSQSERIDELAKMLSGSKTTEAALNNAKELLQL